MNESAEFELKKQLASLEERKVVVLEKENQIKARDSDRSKFANPLFIAIIAASLAGASNAAVALLNGNAQRDLENNKSNADLRLEERRLESARILEAIKTGGDAKKAVTNVKFLIDIGLIKDEDLINKISEYFAKSTPEDLPSFFGTSTNSLNYSVDVGVEDSFVSASTAMDGIIKDYSTILRDQQPSLEQFEFQGIKKVRIKFGPYDKETAVRLCNDLESLGKSCNVIYDVAYNASTIFGGNQGRQYYGLILVPLPPPRPIDVDKGDTAAPAGNGP